MDKQELKLKYQEIIEEVTERINEIGKVLASTFSELYDAKPDGSFPVEMYDEVNHPEDFDWFLDDKVVSDTEADELYDLYEKALDYLNDYRTLLSEYEELISKLDNMVDKWAEY